MNNEDLPEDSDSSDEDYVPDGQKSGDVPSEEESDGDPEEPLSDSEETSRKRMKRTKKGQNKRKKQRKDTVAEPEIEKQPEKTTELTEDEKKKKEDDLWAEFMKDTGFKSKNSTSQQSSQVKPSSTNKSQTKTEEKKEEESQKTVKVTKIFEFAGEEVRVEKEVKADSAEARLLNKAGSTTKGPGFKPKSGGLGGISSVLSQLGKKQKISTLEKSKLDWDKFKKDENIEEELQTYNKGKNGYLDRQDFLERSDLRRFEIEKEVRTVERNKRMNNSV